MEYNSRDTYIGKTNKAHDSLFFGYNGVGEHELKEYLKDGSLVKPSLCAAVTMLVENSILNGMVDELIPITGNHLFKRVIRHNGELDDIDELLDKIDSHLMYYASKYTKEEGKLLSKMDKGFLS